jgi:methylmalonyl-CoA/ethylmalonyl-CoA epimerase
MSDQNQENSIFSKFSKVDQIGIVVKNMDKILEHFKKTFGIDPSIVLKSSKKSAILKTGLFYLGDLQIELIQVIEGESIHSKFLKEYGEGLHHLVLFIDDLDTELAVLEKEGIRILDRGIVEGIKL